MYIYIYVSFLWQLKISWFTFSDYTPWNSLQKHLKIGHPSKSWHSNHPFSDVNSLFVSGRVQQKIVTFFQTPPCSHLDTSAMAQMTEIAQVRPGLMGKGNTCDPWDDPDANSTRGAFRMVRISIRMIAIVTNSCKQHFNINCLKLRICMCLIKCVSCNKWMFDDFIFEFWASPFGWNWMTVLDMVMSSKDPVLYSDSVKESCAERTYDSVWVCLREVEGYPTSNKRMAAILSQPVLPVSW